MKNFAYWLNETEGGKTVYSFLVAISVGLLTWATIALINYFGFITHETRETLFGFIPVTSGIITLIYFINKKGLKLEVEED